MVNLHENMIGAFIKKHRRDQGMGRDRFCDIYDVPRSTLHGVEHKGVVPRLSTARQLLDNLGFDIVIVPKNEIDYEGNE